MAPKGESLDRTAVVNKSKRIGHLIENSVILGFRQQTGNSR